jgi:hypothetical protein
MAQQQSFQDNGSQVATTRAERVQQVRQRRAALREARGAALAAKKEAAKARNLARLKKESANTEVATQLAVNP